MDYITLLVSVPAILALVNLLKSLGLPAKLAPVASIIIGVGLNLAVFFLSEYGWFAAAAQGLILALGASGLYDVTPNTKEVVTHVDSDPDRNSIGG